MSGHSKWAKIKRAKTANDVKKGALFTKLAKAITLAAKDGGGDPDMNFTLRLAIDKAKQANMPVDNIERAVKRGTGELAGDEITQITYEAMSSQNLALLIDCSTDNTNRTFSEVKNIVETSGGKMAEAGSVSWQFEELGQIVVAPEKLKKAEKYGQDDYYEVAGLEDLQLEIMDYEGVNDMETVSVDAVDQQSQDFEALVSSKIVYIETDKKSLASISESLSKNKWHILDSSVVKKSNILKSISQEEFDQLAKFVDQLDEHEDVDQVWHNAELE